MAHTPTWTPRRSTRQSPWTAAEAKQTLDAATASGLTLPEFARQHDLRQQVLYNWRHCLAWQAPVPASTALAFVPVIPMVTPAVRRDTGLEVAIGPAIVRVAPDFCTATLARLLPVLVEALRC